MPENRRGRLFYFRVPDEWSKGDKLDFLAEMRLHNIPWRELFPNKDHTWLVSETEAEFAAFVPLGNKKAKRVTVEEARTIFHSYGRGVATSRDSTVYDFNIQALVPRVQELVYSYNREVDRYRRQAKPPAVDNFVDYSTVVWSRDLKLDLRRGKYAEFMAENIRASIYRPFAKKKLYFDRVLNDEVYKQPTYFPGVESEIDNQLIWYKVGSDWPQFGLMVDQIPDLMPQGGSQCFPFYTYDEDGSNRRENITDWALERFRSHYQDQTISKWDIFHYVYGMLHHPGYRSRYAQDLKRSLPRIPFAPDPQPKSLPHKEGGTSKTGFRAFAEAGRALADIHLNYESAQRYELDWQATRSPISYRVEKMLARGKEDSATGEYKVFRSLKYNDTLTLHGIPERAFDYRLGNRSALEWVVDQYRVKTDKRSGITHDPNGYSDDEKYILHLVERVITVSLRTVEIVEGLAEMPFRLE